MAGRGKIENLRPPWKPGQSGNPTGRPKKRPVSDRYAFIAETLIPEKRRVELRLPKGSTYGDAIALKLFDAAIDGKVQAAREIREGIEGKSTERLAEEADMKMSPENNKVVVRIINVADSTEPLSGRPSAPNFSEMKKSEP